MFLKGGKGRAGATADPLAKRPTVSEVSDKMLPTQQLMQSADGKSLLFKQFKLTSVGLEVHGRFSQEDWKAAGRFFRQASSALSWWIGDWINAAPHEWGEMYTAAEAITGLKAKTLQNIAYVCRSFESSRRKEQLLFKHHALLAAEVPEDQDHWLNLAATEKMSANRLARKLKEPDPPDPETPVPQPPPLINRSHRRVWNRLWKGVLSPDPLRLASRSDIQHLRVWLDDLETALDDLEKRKVEQPAASEATES